MRPIHKLDDTEALINGIEEAFVEVFAFASRPFGERAFRDVRAFDENGADVSVLIADRLIEEVEIAFSAGSTLFRLNDEKRAESLIGCAVR